MASDAGSDFAVFPEIFTTQLMSFSNEKIPSKAVQRLTFFTEEYINLFTGLAVKYNVNIIGGSHFVEEKEKIYNISYLFRRDGTIEKQYKLHITPNERKWWGISQGDTVKVFDTDCGKIAIQICYDIEFPELARIATDKGAKIIFTPFNTEDRQGYLRVRYCAQREPLKIKFIRSLPGQLEIYQKLKIWIFNMLNQRFSPLQTLNLLGTELLVNVTLILKWWSLGMLI